MKDVIVIEKVKPDNKEEKPKMAIAEEIPVPDMTVADFPEPDGVPDLSLFLSTDTVIKGKRKIAVKKDG